MLYKFRCNLMHPFYGALPVPYVPVRVTRGALVTHRHTYPPSRCRTLIPLSAALWNDLTDHVFDGVGLSGFKSRANAFSLALTARYLFVFYCFSLSRLPVYRLVLWGWGLSIDRV